MTPESIRKLADDGLHYPNDKDRASKVLRALADVVEAAQECVSTLQDLSASDRAYGHDVAATAAEVAEKHGRAALARVEALKP